VRELSDLNLKRIDFMLDVVINSLTFVFTNGMRSPPAQSYTVTTSTSSFSAEPCHKYELPSNVALAEIKFGSNDYDRLNTICLYD